MSEVDLHIHSTASDGRLTPAEIVNKSAGLGITTIALADHDTVSGIAPALEAARVFPWLQVIPCVEISTNMDAGTVHILGYFIDFNSLELQDTLDGLRISRQKRAQSMVAKLRELGVQIEWQRVMEIAGSGLICRPHIAQAMLEKGYITTFKEAFTRYIGQGGPAYVERQKITPKGAVELVLRNKGLPILAHPLTIDSPERMIVRLKTNGLAGIEAYYNGYTADEINKLVTLADKYDLVVTGGSDYHGLDEGSETMIGGVAVPMESVKRLMALTEQRALRSADSYIKDNYGS